MKFLASEVVLMASEEVKRKSIGITQQTKDSLDSIKHTGQSYDGLVQELVKFWHDKKGESWTRKKKLGQGR